MMIYSFAITLIIILSGIVLWSVVKKLREAWNDVGNTAQFQIQIAGGCLLLFVIAWAIVHLIIT